MHEKILEYINNNTIDEDARKYYIFRNTPEWDEQYKYDLLKKINKQHLFETLSSDNIKNIIKILQDNNPSKGSFVYWTELDNLSKVANMVPDKVAYIVENLVNGPTSISMRMNKAHIGLKSLVDKGNFGSALLSYILAANDYTTYPIYKESSFKIFLKYIKYKEVLPVTIGDKYELFVAFCEKIALYFRDNNIINDASLLDGQDFIYCIGNYSYFGINTMNVTSAKLHEYIKNFIIQSKSKTADLKYKMYVGTYEGYAIKASFGQGGKALITWMTFLKDKNTTSKGIYPGILYDWQNDKIITIFGVSETNVPEQMWNNDVTSLYAQVVSYDDATDNLKNKYPNSYVYSVYNASEEVDSNTIDSIINDINYISSIYDGYSVFNDSKATNSIIYCSFSEFLNKKGYVYEQQTIENYLLSLKVKPFVILTGNSGTGKTKLAQLFGQYISSGINSNNIISTDVKIGESGKNGGWSLKREDIFKYYPSMASFEKNLPIRVAGVDATGNLKINTRLFFDKDSGLADYLEEQKKEDPNKRVKLQLFPSNIHESYYSIIPVGANWTENRHIIGYHNVITNRYHATKALDLINAAKNNPNKPYFLILDEMNLSHVERYFSDFLSAMESGEPIPIPNEPDSDISSITIPPNLFVIGTVNIDETTYMFSPKVLDRANTMEFDAINANSYLNGILENNHSFHNINYLENPLDNSNVQTMTIEDIRIEMKDISLPDNKLFWDTFSQELYEFQELLKPCRLGFGYRVINEIARFMYVAWVYDGSPAIWHSYNRYFDAQIKQKILPKIHGSSRTLDNTLKEMAGKCKGEGDEVKYPTSYDKLQEMGRILDIQRYVSFTC